MGYIKGEREPADITLFVQLEGEDEIRLQEDDDINEAERKAAGEMTELMHYFDRPNDPCFDDLTNQWYYKKYRVLRTMGHFHARCEVPQCLEGRCVGPAHCGQAPIWHTHQ